MIFHSRITKQQGFTLLELMITIAIIAIIAAIAIPSYIDYTKRARYSELVRATAPYKLGVVQCYNMTGDFSVCNSNSATIHGIPPSIVKTPNASSAIRRISVAKGIITATPNPVGGINADDIYVLTPTASNGIVSWTESGKGVDKGLTK